MDNPYIFRGPVHDPDMFFGRTHELNEIAAFLRGNQSVSIVGPRKIGKTSLLFHLMRPETWPSLGLGEDILFVYLDCEVLGEGSHAEILSQFAGEIATALDERGLPPEPALEKAMDMLGLGEPVQSRPSISPDLILLDVLMAGPDGFEVCERIREQERMAHVPIIMVTALGSLTDRVKGLEYGADDYIVIVKSEKLALLMKEADETLPRSLIEASARLNLMDCSND